MKRLFGLAALLLGWTSVAQAQGTAATLTPASTTALTPTLMPALMPALMNDQSDLSTDPSASSMAKITPFEPVFSWDELLAAKAIPAVAPGVLAAAPTPLAFAPDAGDPAASAPAPKPKFVFGGRDDYRWQLSLGVDWIRFRSSVFDASAVGFRTAVTYYTNSWFGIEGSVSAAFAPQIFDKEHVKLVVYGGGPKIAWRQRQWEPWLHAIVGGAHEQPQTEEGGRNAFAVQLGGGADYRFNPRFSGRLQAEYVRTSFWSQAQNNFQLSAGLVIHF